MALREDRRNFIDPRKRCVKIETVRPQAGGICNHHEFAQIRYGPLGETGNGFVSGSEDLAYVPFAKSPMTFQIHVFRSPLVADEAARRGIEDEIVLARLAGADD